MKSREIRNEFVQYFENNGHRHIPSSSLIPADDPTLLFANAGMNQFKNVFLGLEKLDSPRAVTVQKCVRAGGKHNDLENVGFTARHHTFFEMLGNFSFADYFKKDAIHFAWELLTKKLNIPKEKLYVTVFHEDDESAEIWNKQEGVPKERIYRLGEKDNFWRMGDTGPCGPCTEIFYDHGPGADAAALQPSEMGGEGDRFVEIWNLVFMQYNEDGTGRHPLPKPCVDTGSGFERMTAALQGKYNNYDTDLFKPMMDTAQKISGKPYETDLLILKDNAEARQITAAFRVVADHARAAGFLIADGVLPSNDGRGYVLRRIIRRAIRYARTLSENPQIFPQVVASVLDSMNEFYPYLNGRREIVLRTVEDEVMRFLQTLDQGTDILESQLKRLAKGDTLDGEVVFKLYDTFGFPVDLTRLIAGERGVQVNELTFEAHMKEAREKAKASWKGSGPTADQQHMVQWTARVAEEKRATLFKGYESLSQKGSVLALSNGKESVAALEKGQHGYAILDETPFYAESGGQVGDQGTFIGEGLKGEVLNATKKQNLHVLEVKIEEGTLKVGSQIEQTVDDSFRRATMANHSATHLMHSALRAVLGGHVTQAGSLVSPERLRFDFTHNAPLSAEQIKKIEALVNAEISKAHEVDTAEKSYDEAVKSGAMALFGEKYGDRVRVIQMGDFSTELCGGTHVHNTAVIRLFKVVAETGVSSGVRRIEAITGDRAAEYYQKTDSIVSLLKDQMHVHESWTQVLELPAEKSALLQWLEKNRQQLKDLEKSLRSLQSGSVSLDSFISEAVPLVRGTAQGKLVVAHVEIEDRKVLSEMSDQLRDRIQSGVVILVGKHDGSSGHPLIVHVSKDFTSTLKAGDVVKTLTQKLGGKGGGRPDFAQGSIAHIEGLTEIGRGLA